MNTKSYLKEIISYKEISGRDGSLKEAAELIQGIPSATLLFHISRISITLYLDQPGKDSVIKQNRILNSYLPKCDPKLITLFSDAFEVIRKRGNWQVIFWEYSNMLFCDLIFKNHNDLALREFSGDEYERFLKAYLMINSVVNNGFKISEEDIRRAVDKDEIERVLVPGFIYQRDYISNLDFSNQFNRGLMFFEYLEKEPRFNGYLPGFYAELGVDGKQDLYKTLLTIFVQCEVQKDPELRRCQIGFEGLEDQIKIEYVEGISINKKISNYISDTSFSEIRINPLYKLAEKAYLMLSMNFFLDKLFKSQVFAFKKYIDAQGFTGNFLSIKGKEFMEDIYLRSVMEDCFPNYKTLNGDQAKTISGGELCDYYIRKGNKIILIEFKDILLSAKIKEDSLEDGVYNELNIKFLKNQKNKAKGITQLFNAVEYLSSDEVSADKLDRRNGIEIYPLIVYTDITFGAEGVNKILNDQFKIMLKNRPESDVKVEGVTFINLSYFESHYEYIKGELIDFFSFITDYQQHISQPENATASFEVYSRVYFANNNIPDIQSSYKLNENFAKIQLDVSEN